MQRNIKIGLVARCDDSGLGTMSLDFYKNLKPDKTLLIFGNYENHPERYPEAMWAERGIPTLEEIKTFVDGLDLIITIETPYNWNLYKIAREKGVKTILIPMYEWFPQEETIQEPPDLYLCPSSLEMDVIKAENKLLLPTPVNRNEIPFKLRELAKTFIFNNGHGGAGGRNGLYEFLQAISFIKSDVKFLIRSQVYFEQSISDKRVEIEMKEIPRENLWKDGDIYIHLHKHDGLSLSLNEALSAGYPIIALDIKPHNVYLPKELLIQIDGITKVTLGRDIESSIFSPIKLAQKIDEVAQMSSEEIKELSQKSNELAKKISWEELLPFYERVFIKLCKKEQ